MNITNSTDISILQVRAIFNLATAIPSINFVNLSAGAHLNLMSYAFEVYSPNNIPIHVGNFTTPDKTGPWSTHTLSEALFTFQSAVEWSGAPYRVKISARDSALNIFVLPDKLIYLQVPAGNEKVGGNYGEGNIDVQVSCEAKQAYIRDRTAYSYQGVKGVIDTVSSQMTVIQPPDATGVPPNPQVFTGYSQIAFPLYISGEGYKVVLVSYVDYDMGDDAVIRLKYIKTQNFNVNCNYDLCPLLYEFARMLDEAAISCDDKLNRKIARINALITNAIIAKMQPTCGVDLGKLITEIKDLAGWTCDCNCTAPIGMNGNPITTGTPSALNFQFSTGGDLTAGATVTGNNILLTLKDYRYIFQIGALPTSQAFSITPSTATDLKTFTLTVDTGVLAADLLSKIGSVPALMDVFNSLVRGSFNFTVDGKCVIASGAACDYAFSISSIPLSPSTALFKSIIIGGVTYNINISFSTSTGTAAIKTALDALNKGVFTVTVSGGSLIVSTLQNTFTISDAIVFGAGAASDKLMAVTKSNCSGTTSYTPSQIVQAMIDYLCLINASQVRLGYDFLFAKMKSDGTLNEVAFKSTDSLKQFIDAVTANSYMAIAVAKSTTITFASIQALFANTTSFIKATDIIYGTRDGQPGQWTQTDILKSIISSVKGTNDTALLADWCLAINRCSVAVCNAVTSGVVAMRTKNKDDFKMSGVDLVYAGFYSSLLVLDEAVTVTLIAYDATGNPGVTGTIIMAQGTSKTTNAVAALPALAAGFTWKVTAISTISTAIYLSVAVLNNGAASYKVATRKTGSGLVLSYTTYPAQSGQYTNLLFVVAAGEYEAYMIAVCGVNNESIPTVAASSGCPAPTAFNVVKQGADFLVTYSFPVPVTLYNLAITYPSLGGEDKVFTVLSPGQLTVTVPAGVPGDYTFKIRAVCDQASLWFGPYSSPVVVNIPVALTPAPVALTMSAITTTTATATATAPTPAPAATSMTLVLQAVGGGPTYTYTQAPSLLVWYLTGLTPGVQYNASVFYSYNGVDSSSVSAIFSTVAAQVNHSVYYGWTPDPVDAGSVDAVFSTVLQDQITIVAGQLVIDVDFRIAPQYKNFIIREEATEPVKTRYTNNLNNEPIPNFTFAAPVVIGVYRYYFTNGPVSFDPSDKVHLYTF